MNYTSELQQIGLFEHLSENELRMLSTTLLEKPCSRGQVLFRQGDPALGCFVILNGEVGVFLGEPVAGSTPVAVLKSGETVGHLALVDRQRRSAQCIVVSESARLAELRVDDFERLFNAQTPFAAASRRPPAPQKPDYCPWANSRRHHAGRSFDRQRSQALPIQRPLAF